MFLPTALLVLVAALQSGAGRSVVPVDPVPKEPAALLSLATADGKPAAGLSVECSNFAGIGRASYHARAMTDERGIARFGAEALVCHRGHESRFVVVELVTRDSTLVVVPPDFLVAEGESEPRPFVVPDYGFVDILSIDGARGQAPGRSAWVTAANPHTSGETSRSVALPLERPWRIAAALAAGGDEFFHVHVDVPGAFPSEWVEVARPSAPNEIRRESVRLRDDGLELALRLMNEEGLPARRRSATVQLMPQVGWFERELLHAWTGEVQEIESDEAGWVVLRLPAAWRRIAFDVGIEVGERYGRAPVPPSDSGRRESIVVLGAMPVLLRGRVIDEEGQPVRGARVMSFLPNCYGPPLPEALSDAHGEFELRAAPYFAKYGWGVLCEGFAPSMLAHGAPHAPLDVVLRRTGTSTVAGRVHRTVSDGGEKLFARLSPHPSHPPGTRDITANVGRDGAFRLERVREGSWRFSLNLGVHELFALDGIVVPRANQVADPRLVGLDLAELVREQRIRVVQGDGTPAVQETQRSPFARRRFGIGVRSSESASHFDKLYPEHLGDIVRLVPAGPVDVLLEGDGIETQFVRGAFDPVTLSLVPAGRLRVHLNDPPRLPAPVELTPRLVPLEPPRWWQAHHGTLEQDDAGAFAGTITARGAFRVEWAIAIRDVRVPLDESAPLVCDLDPAGGDRELRAGLETAALERALAALRAHEPK